MKEVVIFIDDRLEIEAIRLKPVAALTSEGVNDSTDNATTLSTASMTGPNGGDQDMDVAYD